MIRSWGMSDALGPLSYEVGEEQIFLGREISQHRDYSESTAQQIDSEVHHLIESAYNRAKKILTDNMDILHKLSEMLVERETVLGYELDDLIYELRPGIQLPTKRAQKPGKGPGEPPRAEGERPEEETPEQPDLDGEEPEKPDDEPS
jgi:cell division protease FtsH